MDLNIGIAGVGNFARFAANAFLKIPGIKIIAVTDINEPLVKEMANVFNATGYTKYGDFLEDSNIDLVYIATPPWLHYQQSKLALLKNKHVICEKPAALHTIEATELAALATSLDLLWVVNLMQRYNPMYDIVKKIIDEKILGSFLHGFFENYASDENLGLHHWFWDETKSGGIFIEHGVHFFDMFTGWLGEGKLLYSCEMNREEKDANMTDRVQATVLYNEGIVNFYHGFDQPKILDRQEMRLQFERGEITLYEWIPVKIRLHGLLQKEQRKRLQELIEDFTLVYEKEGSQKSKGRSRDIFFDTHIILEHGDTSAKQECYEALLKAMMHDQWNWIKNRRHTRVVDERNGIQSLKMAEAANRLAKKNKISHE